MINLFAKKLGMSHIHQETGVSLPLTLLKLYDSCVIEKISEEGKDYDKVIIGYNKAVKAKKVKKPVSGVFAKKGLAIYKKIYTSKVKTKNECEAGKELDVTSFFKEGDKIGVSGNSIGKGFAGVMKRHNFRGLEATHGVSISHRSHGSTGQCQDPGKVFKGKKMAGQMGNKKVTVKNLKIVTIDKENKIIAIKGCVPGSKNSDVIIKIS